MCTDAACPSSYCLVEMRAWGMGAHAYTLAAAFAVVIHPLSLTHKSYVFSQHP